MLNQLFDSVFSNNRISIDPFMFVLSMITSLVLGLLLAKVYKYRTIYTKEFIITLAVLPILIAVIIFLVNGSLGTSVAVAGTFGLIRFRSAAGGAKEILFVFIATAIGIATGMGFLVLGILFTISLLFILYLYEHSSFAQVSQTRRHVTFTVPNDNTEYEAVLTKVLARTCKHAELVFIKNINKDNRIQLEYNLDLKVDYSDIKLINDIIAYNPDIEVAIGATAKKKKIL